MNQQYEELHKHAQELEFRFRDVVDQPDHPIARAVRDELHHLEDDAQENKNTRDIVARIEKVQQKLLQAQHGGDQIMDPRHSVALHDELERLRRNVRSWPNY